MEADHVHFWVQDDESPLHLVTFDSPFEIMSTEVPQRIWVNVMGSNPSTFQDDSLPVDYVNWLECQEFIDCLNTIDPDYNYRLPTEAEWEYACRAGTETYFYWGNDNSTGTVTQYGWYNPNSGSTTHPVGSLEANSWGLYDMSGNVCEWCQDVDHDDYAGAPTDGSAWYSGGNQGYRIHRGGSWSNQAQFLRSANRSSLNEELRSMSCGLRLVRKAK
ncbi:MAG: formylglycine-generating enzyme family protein [Candidatus Sabulitectum sp.]|nr:formylglycine-generating enzyme family protein [Candidatus Sabulitectum sp.]